MGGAVVWRLSDGKPGHDNQSRGLLEALGRLTSLECVELSVHDPGKPGPWSSILSVVRHGPGSPRPTLIVGAGHATHLPLLAAGRVHRARTVVLMKPSVPLACFDLCLVPAHDAPPARDNVIVTQGVLNTVRASPRPRPGSGLILIGGPSAHYSWDEAALARRIRAILDADRAIAWRIADSRRTPASTRRLLSAIPAPNCAFVPHEETGSGWLPEALAESGTLWVTEDSVSMLFEALTAGTATGVLPVPRRRKSLLSPSRSNLNRLSKGVDALVASGRVTAYEHWIAGKALLPPPAPLAEAERCARLILARWPEIDSHDGAP